MNGNAKMTPLGIAAIVLAIAGLLFAAFAFFVSLPATPSRNAVSFDSPASDKLETNSEPGLELVDNPVDFDAEPANYPDMYAWIKVSGTDIDFPIVQHPLDDSYYLNHNAYGEADDNGAIYTQLCNSKDMQDPVTVIYGHNMNLSGAMLNQLLLFQDRDFFDANEYFEIYMPGRIMRYRIISAYTTDDRHIMNSFDFSNETIRKEYFDSVLHPHSMIANVRDGASLDENDKIVQISTCTDVFDERYILTGVLVETELAK